MSYEKLTRLKPDVPIGESVVVARLADIAGRPYTQNHADFLLDIMRDDSLAAPPRVEAHNNLLFIALHVSGHQKMAASSESARLIYRGISRLDLNPEIVARADRADELSPERSLYKSLPYLVNDVTLELREAISELEIHSPDYSDMTFELNHLTSH